MQDCQRDLRRSEFWAGGRGTNDLAVVRKQQLNAVQFINGVMHLRENKTIHLKLNLDIDVHILVQLQLLAATMITSA